MPATFHLLSKSMLNLNALNTFNVQFSKLDVLLQTDTKKPIKKEPVVVITPAGIFLMEETDDSGIAKFEIAVPPGSPVLVVLPYVLESWVKQSSRGDKKLMALTGIVPRLELESPKLDREDAAITNTNITKENREDYTKRLMELNMLTKAEVQKKAWEEKEREEKSNKSKDKKKKKTPKPTEKMYTDFDFRKYLAMTWRTSSDDKLKITVDGLTKEEKFEYFKEVVLKYQATYCRGYNHFSVTDRCWVWQGGAVCNQIANLFMGFWVNHNSGFTQAASSTDFILQFENDSKLDSKSKIYAYRGFRDVTENVLPGEPTDPPKNKKDLGPHQVELTDIKGSGPKVFDHFEVHFEDSDKKTKNKNWDDKNGRFSDPAIQDKIEFMNVYEVSDSLGFNHHGGMMILEAASDPDTGAANAHQLHKLAADGYWKYYFKYKGKIYPAFPEKAGPLSDWDKKYHKLTGDSIFDGKTKSIYTVKSGLKVQRFKCQAIEYHTFDDKGGRSRTNYTLRVYAFGDLRKGGYAPADTDGKYSGATYVAEDTKYAQEKDIDTSSVNFRVWLPRFVAWSALTGPESTQSFDDFEKANQADMMKAGDFMAIPLTKFKVTYLEKETDPETKAKTEDVEAGGDNIAKQLFLEAHPKFKVLKVEKK